MRRAVPYLLCLLLLLAAAGMVRFGLGLAGDLADNRTIRDLHAGRTAEPRDAGDPRAHLAMALFLSWRGRIAEAEALERTIAWFREQRDARFDAPPLSPDATAHILAGS